MFWEKIFDPIWYRPSTLFLQIFVHLGVAGVVLVLGMIFDKKRKSEN